MFKKILIATDLSAASQAVVQCATGLRSLGVEECLLLQCMNMREPAAFGAELASCVVEKTLLDQKTVLENSGFRVQTEVAPGYAQVEINRVARERGAALIVIGSHGRTLLGEVLLGGVADAVLHQAATPVLLVRVARGADARVLCAMGATCDFTRRVLFATDFSENAADAFETVKDLVASGAEAVSLLHIQDRDRIEPHLIDRLDEFNRRDRERLEALQTTLASAGAARVDVQIRLGHPGREILKEVDLGGATLVVMGTQGRSALDEMLLGSVSHYVARRSKAPVLLVPIHRRRDIKTTKGNNKMKIQILGTGCPKCKQLTANAQAAVAALGIEATIEKVEKIDEIMAFGVMITPALAVDGVVKSAGKVLSPDDIKKFL